MTKFSGSDAGLTVCAVGGVAVAGVVAYFSYRYLTGKCCQGGGKENIVNPDIQKDSEKVVHSFDIEDLGDKQSYCRCWRSKKFPMCDGSHNKHNEATGDNVGPLCINKKKA